GVRGYVTAYDSETGNQLWRWFTVPGDPSKPFEDASMEAAAKTWDPAGKYWINGGGGAPWDSVKFDPGLNMGYGGTGNCDPAEAETAVRGIGSSAVRRVATISILPPSSRSTPTPANTSGITRRRPATIGTIRQPSR